MRLRGPRSMFGYDVIRPVLGLSGVVAVALALVALAPGTAIAQTAEPGAGITVTGYGEASAPADSGTLQLLVTRGEYYGGPPPRPRAGDIPGAEERELAAPIVEAIVAKGVATSNVTVVVSPVLGSSVYGPGGPVVARIDVDLERPDLATVADLVSTASVAAAGEDLILGQVGISYGVEDCAALERQARQAAIVDARARAEIQADLLGVALGEVIASRDLPAAATTSINYYGVVVPLGGCAPPAPSVALSGAGLTVTVPTFDPTAEAEVELYAQVSLTFAIAA